VLLAGLFVLNAGAYSIQKIGRARALQDARALRVESFQSGRDVTIGELVGHKPVLLVFWTTWCAYCGQELKDGTGLVEKLAEGPVPTEVLFVNVREHRLNVEADRDIRPVLDRVVLDPSGTLVDAFGVTGFPANVLVSEQGEKIWTLMGLQENIAATVRSSLSPGASSQ